MKKIIILTTLLSLFVLSGCTSYNMCKADCVQINEQEFPSCDLITKSGSFSCKNQTEYIELKELCYNECRLT